MAKERCCWKREGSSSSGTAQVRCCVFGSFLWRRRRVQELGGDSGGQGGGTSALLEAGYLEAAPTIWASARSELRNEAVKKSIWRGASAESEYDQGL
ncbi:MAG: hypothetical protein GY821_03410 [Gammaproteobacteria bacterium]|nr:hypothetical protein [Gammaproteobacteria bacterium]